MSKLQAVEEQLASQASDPAGQTARYVDYVPHPRRFGLIHYAAHQGRPASLKQLLIDFKANPDLLTSDGLKADDLVNGPNRVAMLNFLAKARSLGTREWTAPLIERTVTPAEPAAVEYVPVSGEVEVWCNTAQKWMPARLKAFALAEAGVNPGTLLVEYDLAGERKCQQISPSCFATTLRAVRRPCSMHGYLPVTGEVGVFSSRAQQWLPGRVTGIALAVAGVDPGTIIVDIDFADRMLRARLISPTNSEVILRAPSVMHPMNA